MIDSPPNEDDYQLSDSDEELRVRDSQTEIAVVEPGADLTTVNAGTAVHDPERARQVVATLGSVSEVVEVLPPRPLNECTLMPYEPADLDLVVVGCWGGVIQVNDPGLACGFVDFAESEVENQRSLRPEARIVSTVFLDMVADIMEVIIALPGMKPVREFNDSEEIEIDGDPSALLRSLGLDETSEPDFQDLARRALGFTSYADGPTNLMASTFRVRRPCTTVEGMEECWMHE